MKRIILLLFGLLPPAGLSQGITPGKYLISFGISDAGWSQTVKIANFSTNSVCTNFDVLIEEDGSFKRSNASRQLVRGLVYGNKFKFIIPDANVNNVYPYIFEADNTEKNGRFEGSCDVLFTGPNSDRTGKFHFTMQRIAPNKSGPANGRPPVNSETNRTAEAAGSRR